MRFLTTEPVPFAGKAIAIICHFNMTWQGNPKTEGHYSSERILFSSLFALTLEYHYDYPDVVWATYNDIMQNKRTEKEGKGG